MSHNCCYDIFPLVLFYSWLTPIKPHCLDSWIQSFSGPIALPLTMSRVLLCTLQSIQPWVGHYSSYPWHLWCHSYANLIGTSAVELRTEQTEDSVTEQTLVSVSFATAKPEHPWHRPCGCNFTIQHFFRIRGVLACGTVLFYWSLLIVSLWADHLYIRICIKQRDSQHKANASKLISSGVFKPTYSTYTVQEWLTIHSFATITLMFLQSKSKWIREHPVSAAGSFQVLCFKVQNDHFLVYLSQTASMYLELCWYLEAFHSLLEKVVLFYPALGIVLQTQTAHN